MPKIIEFLKHHSKLFAAVAFSALGYVGSTTLAMVNQDPISKTVRYFNDVYHIVFQNSCSVPIQISFGDLTSNSREYDEPIVLQPKEAISRQLQTGLRSLRSKRYFVIVSKGNRADPKVDKCEFVYVYPGDQQFSKVVRFTDDRVDFINNPTERHWHTGRMEIYKPHSVDFMHLFKNFKIVYTIDSGDSIGGGEWVDE